MLHPRIKTATGAHRIRSHLLGVARFAMVLSVLKATTPQIRRFDSESHSGKSTPARTNTIPPVKAKMIN